MKTSPEKNDLNLRLWVVISVLTVALVISAVGAFYFGGYDLHNQNSWNSFISEMLLAVAGTCFSAILIGIAFDVFMKKSTAQEFGEIVGKGLENSRLAMVSSFLLDKSIIAQAFEGDTEKLASVAKNCLEIRLGSQGAEEAIALIDRTIRSREYRLDFRYVIALSRLGSEYSKELRDSYYNAEIELSYITELQSNTFRVACARNELEFYSLAKGTEYIYREILDLIDEPVDEKTFWIRSMKVEDINLVPRLTSGRGIFEIVCESATIDDQKRLDDLRGKQVRLTLEIKTRVSRNQHQYPAYIVYPVRGARIEIVYYDTDIKSIDAIQFVTSHSQTFNVERRTANNKPYAFTLSTTEWVFPTSGVSFVWT